MIKNLEIDQCIILIFLSVPLQNSYLVPKSFSLAVSNRFGASDDTSTEIRFYGWVWRRIRKSYNQYSDNGFYGPRESMPAHQVETTPTRTPNRIRIRIGIRSPNGSRIWLRLLINRLHHLRWRLLFGGGANHVALWYH